MRRDHSGELCNSHFPRHVRLFELSNSRILPVHVLLNAHLINLHALFIPISPLQTFQFG